MRLYYRASWHSQWPAVACSARCLEQIGMLQAYGHGPDWGYSVHRACHRACRWRLRQPTRTDASSSGLALRFAPLQPPALSEVQLPRCLWSLACGLLPRFSCMHSKAPGLTSGSPIVQTTCGYRWNLHSHRCGHWELPEERHQQTVRAHCSFATQQA